MILEVAWTRRLATPLGGSVYAFTLMLTAFLTGIALGSRFFRGDPQSQHAPGQDTSILISFASLVSHRRLGN